MRRRFVVATGSPAASKFGRYCLLLVFRESLRLDDVSGATSFELVATLRFEVATGSSREKRCVVLSCDWIPSCWFSMRRRLRCEGERQYRTLISLLGSLATMHRVVNYHSSWARKQQVELFDASGNPGSTAGRGFNPAGGAPGGG
ncbi:FBD, F-box, Skp2-like and leucine rich repeat domain-containing protein [Dorcoceras hygrometricum]|uniref:FBD, F-box, Skp2-like and leucine rich repeat domain-containing protein n=1 Tax=Dorcoceras hygrometricum TaxID=472368 RepID=A0A2Z7AD61_9LAMI|nr:FBD, F-box, Skp2-like and leucine rich repeat domain-containing protein [Dorcoceras hygrometricum]